MRGCVFIGRGGIAQSVLQTDFLLQERLHLDRILAGRGLELALNVVQTTAQVNAPQRADRAFQPLGR